MDRLLAKSYDVRKYGESPPDFALLTQHTFDVVEACGAIVDAIGKRTLRNLGLDGGAIDKLRILLRANGWIQDLGKANSHFQRMVMGQPELTQLLRHEIISGLIVWHLPELRAWIGATSYDALPAVWGAMGHHRKFDERTQPAHVPNAEVFVTHRDFTAVLDAMGADLGIGPAPQFVQNIFLGRVSGGSCEVVLPGNLDEIVDEFEDMEFAFENVENRRWLAVVKSFGIAADVIASAVAAGFQMKTKYSVCKFVSETLVNTALQPDDLAGLIRSWAWDHTDSTVGPRNESVLPPNFVFRNFQNQVAESSSFLTLACAGCGSGKSLAAYLWARRWCEDVTDGERSAFRLFVCLPTTGTATEHFKDYALESGIASSLSHSRASIDLTAISETVAQEETDNQDYTAAEAARALLAAERDKIDSLKLWSTPLVVGTADTVLGLMANGRRSIYCFPAVMCGAVVFDEIHAFDDRLFGHLLVFIKNFPRLPILLMTASLPEKRRKAIESVRPDLCVVPGPDGFEKLERYFVAEPDDENSIWQEVEKCIAANGKVLWVRNRVEWANDAYRKCKARFVNTWVNVYHSRLRYKDRSRRHRSVIDRFKNRGSAGILVATQVAEMSLDLSADLLVTDIAPISALIQRMGRLNRRSNPDCPESPKVALVCPLPRNQWRVETPYDESDVDAARQWMRKLMLLGKPLCQRDLSDAFAGSCPTNDYEVGIAEERAGFFGMPGKSGIWRTRPGLTRDEGYTVTVILQRDFEACGERDRRGNPTRDWLRNHEVAIPFKDPVLQWQRISTLRVAPAESVAYDYDPDTHEGTGATWQE